MPNQFFSPEGDLENYFVSEYWLIDQYVGDELWTWGANVSTQLGINDVGNRSTPVTTFAGGTNWKQVSSGGYHTAAIKTDGTLWTWGFNSSAQLGINATGNRNTPVTTFAGGTNWKQVSSGSSNIAAIKTDGTLWTWGNNVYAQLGINATGNRNTPVTTFAGGTNWKQVSFGFNSISAIKTDGTLWTWGRDINGMLGINATGTRSTPVTTFAGGTNWKQVSCSFSHMAAIKTDGTLWVWGDSSNGRLGNNTFLSTAARSTPITTFAGGTNWKEVDIGIASAAIKTDGTLWLWGQNYNGQLGDASVSSKATPITTFAGGTNWKTLSFSVGDTTARNTVAAIKTDGTLWTWGVNSYAQLGINAAGNRSTPVTTFAGGTNWKQVSIGNAHTSAVFSGTTPDLPIS